MYTSKFINQNFLIKAYGRDADGKRINTLLGVTGFVKLVGQEFADKFITRALNDINHDKTVCKLRRGIQISLYNN